MGWPSDPVAREAFRQRLRAAQQTRWAAPGAREKASARATQQWSDPAARKRMSEIKRAQVTTTQRDRARDQMRQLHERGLSGGPAVQKARRRRMIKAAVEGRA